MTVRQFYTIVHGHFKALGWILGWSGDLLFFMQDLKMIMALENPITSFELRVSLPGDDLAI